MPRCVTLPPCTFGSLVDEHRCVVSTLLQAVVFESAHLVYRVVRLAPTCGQRALVMPINSKRLVDSQLAAVHLGRRAHLPG